MFPRNTVTAMTMAFNDDITPPPKLPDLSRVMTLPTEIRALIFQHAVTSPLLVTYKLDPFMKDSYTEAVQPALTRVSRQVRAESLPLFYESNDFVLHTEGTKSDDGRRWLRCNAAHLPKLGRVSFWLRYVTLAHDRSTSQGAFSVSLRRPKRGADWRVDDNDDAPAWRWITVVRKPADMARDADFLLQSLRDMLAEVSRPGAGPNDYYGLMMDLRMVYLNHKMS